ncbi:hypothetical protein [Haladaptatus sp. NG-WS-4]
MHRRHLLTTLGATIGGGCLSLGGSSAPPLLGRIFVVNRAYEPQTVHVLAERDGQFVYWADHEATAGDDSGPGGAKIPCAWSNEEGRYVVRARLDTRTTWQSINLTDYDSDLLGLALHVGDENTDRHDTPDLTIWHTSNPSERCETATTTTDSSTT